ncbi:cytosolic phospholipase A2 gamma-like isoform X1 [Aquarana catesbeiana]|uniref:cytosolic phospholipase A2 gamma-like isoform X1 n=2 Tax=Aquarana catesbeiana TaxID=8400 RepID=UPI003CC9CC93
MAANKENIEYIADGSEGEPKSVSARTRKVKETLSSLGMNVRENCDPPVIAVLGSGGGLRAMVGFLGTISKLSELNLLGATTYIAGISGSTWCMSSLYSKKNWSDFSCMEDLENQLREQMKLETERKCPWERIKKKFLGDSYSLTDFWAYTFVLHALNTFNEGKLSSHKETCETGEDPYPIYSAVRKYQIHESKAEAWFEFTPHRSGFPAYERYIKTEHLGCRFKGGRLLEEQPEHDLMYLQGLWGSAPGADWVWLFFHDLHANFIQWLKGDKSKKFSVEMKQDMPKKFSPEMELEIIGNLQLHSSFLDSLEDVYDDIVVIKNIASCLLEWKWGTTNNFLYKCKDKIPKGCGLFDKKHIHLIDAGLEINTPYPLVLRPHRKVDLILSFDFSAGDPFETVKETVKYCKAHQIPFPKIAEKSYEYLPTKSCYIFEGDGNETLDVMHFPLFNIQTCGDAGKIGNLSQQYATIISSYDESSINQLLDIAKKNVESSLKQIQEKIQQCVQRCNEKGNVSDITDHHGSEGITYREERTILELGGQGTHELSGRPPVRAGRCSRMQYILFFILALTCLLVGITFVCLALKGFFCTCPAHEGNITHRLQETERKLNCMTERIQDNVTLGAEIHTCTENWIFQKKKCYFFSDIEESRNESDKFCKSHKAWLATVRSTQTGLLTLVKNMKKGFWIGLVKERRETYKTPLWYWSDNNTEFHVRNDREGITCAKLDQELTAEPCTSKLHWICEKEAEINF